MTTVKIPVVGQDSTTTYRTMRLVEAPREDDDDDEETSSTVKRMQLVDLPDDSFRTPEKPKAPSRAKSPNAPKRPPFLEMPTSPVIEPKRLAFTENHQRQLSPVPEEEEQEEEVAHSTMQQDVASVAVTDAPTVEWTAAAQRCVPPSIPKDKRTKFTNFLNKLRTLEKRKGDPPIKPSSYGELMVLTKEGWKLVRGTSYIDVLRALFVNVAYETAGLCEAVQALKEARLPAAALGSSKANDLYVMGHTRDDKVEDNVQSLLPNSKPPGVAPRVLRIY